MSEPFVFDPRCDACKTPFGAAACGTAVTFHCRPLASEHFSHCALVAVCEFSGTRQELELSLEGPAGERICFSGVFSAPPQPELVWYHFRFWREDGSGCVLDKTGYRSDGQTDPWQLTVYRESRTPDWFGAGVTYQIFPDRFCRLSVPDPDGLVGRRWVHQDWDDTPEWRPDPDGEIRNRDFFGGSLAGITSKLDDLRALGVTTLYLCPIFESASNHRYNTADYTKIDPMLGTEADFRTLCQEAHRRGMRVILDGVFNHTGSQSVYFNADGYYPTLGAAQSQDSPWYSWYRFHHWPDSYDSWWGIHTLPAVEESAPSYVDFIIDGRDSIIRRWLRAGADGWRLDVADELPDWFLEKIRSAMEETKPDSILIGEVWEDGSNKIAYGVRRRHILGGHCDGLMNYPFRNALLSFLLGDDAFHFKQAMETIRENYPPFAWRSAMNFLGTHDTPRILTLLGVGGDGKDHSKDWRAAFRMSDEQYQRGRARLRLGALVLFAFPGSPTIYYGDEAGLEGFEDPFNRRTFPWGREDEELLAWYRALGAARGQLEALRRGELTWLHTRGRVLAFLRGEGERAVLAAVNAGDRPEAITLPWPARDWMTGGELPAGACELPPMTGWLLTPRKPEG